MNGNHLRRLRARRPFLHHPPPSTRAPSVGRAPPHSRPCRAIQSAAQRHTPGRAPPGREARVPAWRPPRSRRGSVAVGGERALLVLRRPLQPHAPCGDLPPTNDRPALLPRRGGRCSGGGGSNTAARGTLHSWVRCLSSVEEMAHPHTHAPHSVDPHGECVEPRAVGRGGGRVGVGSPARQPRMAGRAPT